MFKTLKEAVKWIEEQVKFKPKTDLKRMRNAYKLLNLDFSKVKKIHVAGTNGKGSTCAFISTILVEEGYKVGTFTSPYLIEFNERIQYQFKNISNNELLDLIIEIHHFNQSYNEIYKETLSFFELITLMSLIYFSKKHVDIIVIEVGIGGLLDATNILDYDISLIVSVGFDHMKQLGTTYESIASNILGILKPNNHLITTVDSALHSFFKETIKDRDITADFYTSSDYKRIIEKDAILVDDIEYQVSLKGEHQLLNALLAIKTVRYLFPNHRTASIKRGLANTRWPGRLEKISQNIFLDGAHNTHAINALKQTVKTTFGNKKIWVLFSSLGDKDVLGMLKIIDSFANKIVVTSFNDPRYVDIERQCEIKVDYINDAFSALKMMKSQMDENTVLLITGSLHFIGFVKKTSNTNLAQQNLLLNLKKLVK